MTEYCGCCGREAKRTDGYDGLFCRDCRKHIGPWRYGQGAEERTYFARHGKPCPFERRDERRAG